MTPDTDSVLDAIDDGDVHDQLLLYMDEDDTAEDALGRILRALPSPNHYECRECGRDLTQFTDDGLAGADWLAWRLRVEDSDFRRTDLYCGPVCLNKSTDRTLASVNGDDAVTVASVQHGDGGDDA